MRLRETHSRPSSHARRSSTSSGYSASNRSALVREDVLMIVLARRTTNPHSILLPSAGGTSDTRWLLEILLPRAPRDPQPPPFAPIHPARPASGPRCFACRSPPHSAPPTPAAPPAPDGPLETAAPPPPVAPA